MDPVMNSVIYLTGIAVGVVFGYTIGFLSSTVEQMELTSKQKLIAQKVEENSDYEEDDEREDVEVEDDEEEEDAEDEEVEDVEDEDDEDEDDQDEDEEEEEQATFRGRSVLRRKRNRRDRSTSSESNGSENSDEEDEVNEDWEDPKLDFSVLKYRYFVSNGLVRQKNNAHRSFKNSINGFLSEIPMNFTGYVNFLIIKTSRKKRTTTRRRFFKREMDDEIENIFNEKISNSEKSDAKNSLTKVSENTDICSAPSSYKLSSECYKPPVENKHELVTIGMQILGKTTEEANRLVKEKGYSGVRVIYIGCNFVLDPDTKEDKNLVGVRVNKNGLVTEIIDIGGVDKNKIGMINL